MTFIVLFHRRRSPAFPSIREAVAHLRHLRTLAGEPHEGRLLAVWRIP